MYIQSFLLLNSISSYNCNSYPEIFLLYNFQCKEEYLIKTVFKALLCIHCYIKALIKYLQTIIFHANFIQWYTYIEGAIKVI